jgi:hypothetical protein
MPTSSLPRVSHRLGHRLGGLSALGLGLLALLSITTGCPNNGGGLLDDPGATLLPGIKVNLPPPPSFAEPNIPREYPDGSVSVYGLRKEFHRYSEQKNKYLGNKVKVKAYLLEVYQCPVCPKNQTCKPCDEPHMYIADEPNSPKDKAMVVVEQRAFKAKEPKITVGKQYVFEGVFQLSSPKGFSTNDGLLVFFNMMDDSNKPYLGPNALAEIEAKKLEEAAMKTKVPQPGAAPAPSPRCLFTPQCCPLTFASFSSRFLGLFT